MKLTLHNIKRAFGLLFELAKYEAATLCAQPLRLFCPQYRGLWLLAERGQEARDNAYHLFRHLALQHPELNICYVADKALPDYEHVQRFGKVVQYRSFKHYVLCAASEVKISTHILGYTPDIEKYYMLDKLHAVHGRRVFLQHGILINDILWYHYPNVRTDLFVCTLPQEQEFIEHTFNYPRGVVQRLGLCRFDALAAAPPPKRRVLIMPTWRAYAVENKTQPQFCQTEYFKRWQSLLSSPELDRLLELYGFSLIFYPHYEVQRFLGAFGTGSRRIQLAALGSCDVQALLTSSQVLITDFSSVHFDFAYLKKPVLYYQFDEEQYYAGHYKRGYFNYRTDGFGPVAIDADTLLRTLGTVLEHGCQMTGPYLQRTQAAFEQLEANCCERTYEAIMELWKQ